MRHTRQPAESVRAILAPEDERINVRLGKDTRKMIGQIADVYAASLGHRVSVNNVVYLLAEKALQEMGVQ